MNILIWILVAFVGLAFLFFSIVKIFGVPKKVFTSQKEAHWDQYGLTRNQVRLIGFAELFGAVTIWFWATPYLWLAQSGMVVLMIVTAGAMSFHARYDSVTKEGLPAIMQFSLNGMLLALTLFWVV